MKPLSRFQPPPRREKYDVKLTIRCTKGLKEEIEGLAEKLGFIHTNDLTLQLLREGLGVLRAELKKPSG